MSFTLYVRLCRGEQNSSLYYIEETHYSERMIANMSKASALVDIRCKVSKGTYIRSLVRDIGNKLGSYGTLMDLRRTRQGNFGLDGAYSIDDIKSGNFELKKIGEVLDIPKVWVSEDMLFKIRNGCKVKKFFEGDMALVMDGDSEVAIYRVSEEDEKIAKVYKML